jgi:hypothetical protein
MPACIGTWNCAPAQTCGQPSYGGAFVASGCFYWWWCDPVANAGCMPGEQCHLNGTVPTCGIAGDLGLLAPCAATPELCGPGLACDNDECVPICGDDAACAAAGLAYCAKDPLAPYGICSQAQ